MMDLGEQLLDAIACQARMAYATEQLTQCEAALLLWQQRAKQNGHGFSPGRIQHEVTYYAQQVMRWHTYLDGIAAAPRLILAERLRAPDQDEL